MILWSHEERRIPTKNNSNDKTKEKAIQVPRRPTREKRKGGPTMGHDFRSQEGKKKTWFSDMEKDDAWCLRRRTRCQVWIWKKDLVLGHRNKVAEGFHIRAIQVLIRSGLEVGMWEREAEEERTKSFSPPPSLTPLLPLSRLLFLLLFPSTSASDIVSYGHYLQGFCHWGRITAAGWVREQSRLYLWTSRLPGRPCSFWRSLHRSGHRFSSCL